MPQTSPLRASPAGIILAGFTPLSRPLCGSRGTVPVYRRCGPYINRVSATIARGKRPVPSRTRKLSLSAPMVLRGPLRGRVGRRRTFFADEGRSVRRTALVACSAPPGMDLLCQHHLAAADAQAPADRADRRIPAVAGRRTIRPAGADRPGDPSPAVVGPRARTTTRPAGADRLART